MPTYQYACKQPACGHRFEAVQSFSDDPITACPVCEGQVRKVFSAVGVVFKGSGFYRNDSREPAKTAANGSSSKDGAAKDGSSGEKKTEKVESSSSSSSSSSDSSGSGSSSGSASKSSTPSSSSSGSTSKAAAS